MNELTIADDRKTIQYGSNLTLFYLKGGGTHMLVCVVIIKQAFKFHPLNTDLEQVKIATLITDQLMKWGPFSLTSCVWALLSLTSCIWPIWTPFSLTYIKKVPHFN